MAVTGRRGPALGGPAWQVQAVVSPAPAQECSECNSVGYYVAWDGERRARMVHVRRGACGLGRCARDGGAMKIVLCIDFGGFRLSPRANSRLLELGVGSPDHIARDDSRLVQVVTELGQRAADRGCTLGIAEVPDGIEWVIEEYDGMEHVAQVHQTWRGEAVRS